MAGCGAAGAGVLCLAGEDPSESVVLPDLPGGVIG
jgi:hypothetical protein